MDKQQIFSIVDAQADEYGTPFFLPNSRIATRVFIDEINKPESYIKKHPADFKLVHIGSYDRVQGVIVGFDKPKLVAEAGAFCEVGGIVPSAKER